MMKLVPVCGLVTCLLLVGVAAAGKWPWQRRVGREVEVRHKLAHQQVESTMWPPEPGSPESVDPEQFRRALGVLCPPMPEDRLTKYSTVLLEEAARFEVDPFLLGALVWDQSGCRPKTPDDAIRFGLTRIDVDMHAPHIRRGLYKYYLWRDGGWAEQTLTVDKFPFNRWKAARYDSNLYWAAAILRVFKEQCPSLDQAFPAVAHRHFVSHWFWGDNIKEIEPEDRILTTRRRLVAYYHDTVPAAAGTFMGAPLVSPLDGVPRLVLDYFGNRRGKKGGNGHQGIDLAALQGEPLRAVAAGRVVFSGVDLPGAGQSKQLTPEQSARFPSREMGSGGRYVAINHGGGFRSYYMHMESTAVSDWEEVEAGRIIGTVGRSGAVQSGSHLHLEFRVATGRIDPSDPLADVLVNPHAPRSKNTQ